MRRKAQSKEYKIHLPQGNRSPAFNHSKEFKRRLISDTITVDESQSTTNTKDSKVLLPEKIEDYVLINKQNDGTIVKEKGMNRISSFIMKKNEKYHEAILNPSKSNTNLQIKTNEILNHINLVSIHNKYPITNPSRKSKINIIKSEEVIYAKKKVIQQENSPKCNCICQSKQSTPNKPILVFDINMKTPNKTPKNPTPSQPNNTNTINSNSVNRTTISIIQQATAQSIYIQSIWRGYSLRKALFIKLNKFYCIHRIMSILTRVLEHKNKHRLFKLLKRAIKQNYIKNTINMTKLPIIYYKNKMASPGGATIPLKDKDNADQIIGTRSLKEITLGHVITIMESMTRLLLCKSFTKIYYEGIIQQMKKTCLCKNDPDYKGMMGRANENGQLMKDTKDKDNIINRKIDIININDDIVPRKILTTKELLLKKIILQKTIKEERHIRETFMRLFFSGLFKKMQCVPQRRMNDKQLCQTTKLTKPIQLDIDNYGEKATPTEVNNNILIIQEPELSLGDTALIPPIEQELGVENTEEFLRAGKRACTTKETKKSTLRSQIKERSRKPEPKERLANYIISGYIPKTIHLLRTFGIVYKQTRQSMKCDIDKANIDEIERIKLACQRLKDGQNQKLLQLIALIAKSKQTILQRAITLYHHQFKMLNLQKHRCRHLRLLILKKDSLYFNILKNVFVKFNLRSKLLRIKKRANINDVKKKRKKKKNNTLSQSTIPFATNQLSNSTISSFNDQRYSQALSLTYGDHDYEEEDIDREEREEIIENPYEKLNVIQLSIKLHTYIVAKAKTSLWHYFNKWRTLPEERNYELEKIQCAILLIKVFANTEKRHHKYLKTALLKWERVTNTLNKINQKKIDTIAMKSFQIAGNSIVKIIASKKKREFFDLVEAKASIKGK